MRVSSKAFTLIELLITIAIIAILAVVVVTTINPVQLLAQGRDGNRISDMRNLYGAISFYKSDQLGSPLFSLGSSSVVYVSLPDSTATTPAGSNCASLNLPALPSPYSYHCAGPNYYRKTDGTGWIPVNLSITSTGSPLNSFPADPTNASSSRLYYTYTTNGSQFEFTAAMESAKYKLGGSNDQISGDGGLLASVYEKGTQLGLEPLDYGDSSLVGYWPMNEGTGNFAYDFSGNNSTGTWSGTQAGTSGYYSAGKVGSWAGYFNGTNDYVDAGTVKPSQITITLWTNESSAQTQNCSLVSRGNLNYGSGYFLLLGGSSVTWESSYGGGGYQYNIISASGQPINSWYFLTAVASASNVQLYANGRLVASGSRTNLLSYQSGDTDTMIGSSLSYAPTLINGSWQPCLALIDDIRIYNRALSAAEIQAMYNAGK